MFGKKKKAEARKQAVARANDISRRLAAYDAVREQQDAAQKILRLNELSRDISETLNAQADAASKKAEAAVVKGALGGLGLGAGAVVASVVVFPPAILAFAPVGIGSLLLGDKRSMSILKKNELETGEYTRALKDLRTEIRNAISATVNENVKAISESERYEQVLQVPGVAAQFSKAAAAQIAGAEEAEKAAAEAAKIAAREEALARLQEEKAAAKNRKPDSGLDRIRKFGQ